MSSTVTEGCPSPRFNTVAEAGEELHVTEGFISKVIATGDLRAVKVGGRMVRIRGENLHRLLRPINTPLSRTSDP